MAETFPLIHINGTSGEELLAGVVKALSAIHEAKVALGAAGPHARDYYPQGPGKMAEAWKEHLNRMIKLAEIKQELDAMAEDICRQIEVRNAARK